VRRIAPVVAVVAVFYAILVPLRLVQHDALWFEHVGREFVQTAHTSSYISGLRWDSEVGYDGKYYLAFAADPKHARDYMPGRAGVVYSRLGYPLVSWVAAGGSRAALPAAMLAVNIAAVLGGTLALAVWLVRRRVSPWFAALYGLYPGLIFCAFYDLTEPLAFALVIAGFLVLTRQTRARVVGAAALFAFAALTRESTVPFALAAAACVAVAHPRPRVAAWARGLAFAAATVVPLLVWRHIAGAYTHEATQERSHTPQWYVPFKGFLDWRPLDGEHRLILLTIVLPSLLLALGALVLLVRRRAVIAATLLLVNIVLVVVYLPKNVYIEYRAASRAVIGVLLAAIYCLPAVRARGVPRVTVAVEAVAWSLPCYLLIAWKYGLPTLDRLTL
jgi:hypothetical protein